MTGSDDEDSERDRPSWSDYLIAAGTYLMLFASLLMWVAAWVQEHLEEDTDDGG